MAVKISAYRALLQELSYLVGERHPVNMYNPFRSDFSPLSDSEYKSVKESFDKLKSFSKGTVYGKTDPIKTSNIELNNVYSIQDVLAADKKQIKSELENILEVFKDHKVMPAFYLTFPKVFDELGITMDKDTAEAVSFFSGLDEKYQSNRLWPYSWKRAKEALENGTYRP